MSALSPIEIPSSPDSDIIFIDDIPLRLPFPPRATPKVKNGKSSRNRQSQDRKPTDIELELAHLPTPRSSAPGEARPTSPPPPVAPPAQATPTPSQRYPRWATQETPTQQVPPSARAEEPAVEEDEILHVKSDPDRDPHLEVEVGAERVPTEPIFLAAQEEEPELKTDPDQEPERGERQPELVVKAEIVEIARGDMIEIAEAEVVEMVEPALPVLPNESSESTSESNTDAFPCEPDAVNGDPLFLEGAEPNEPDDPEQDTEPGTETQPQAEIGARVKVEMTSMGLLERAHDNEAEITGVRERAHDYLVAITGEIQDDAENAAEDPRPSATPPTTSAPAPTPVDVSVSFTAPTILEPSSQLTPIPEDSSSSTVVHRAGSKRPPSRSLSRSRSFSRSRAGSPSSGSPSKRPQDDRDEVSIVSASVSQVAGPSTSKRQASVLSQHSQAQSHASGSESQALSQASQSRRSSRSHPRPDYTYPNIRLPRRRAPGVPAAEGRDPLLPPPAKKKRIGNNKGKWAKNKQLAAVMPAYPEGLTAIPYNLRSVLEATLRKGQEDDGKEDDDDNAYLRPFSEGHSRSHEPRYLGHPHVQVRNTGSRGRGLYALKKRAPGDIIYAEAPMVMYKRGASEDEISDAIMKLSYLQQRALWQLEGSGAYQSLVKGMCDANSINCVADADGDDDDPVDIFEGIFEVISRINHSCAPNAGWFWSESAGKLLLVAYLPIEAGDELTASYVDSPTLLQPREARRRALGDIGFDCACSLCTVPDGDGDTNESDRNRTKLRGLFPWTNDTEINELAAQDDILLRLHEAARLLRKERLVHPLIAVYVNQFYVLAAWGKEESAKKVAGFAVAALTCTRGRTEAMKHFFAGLYDNPRSWLSFGFKLE